MVPLVPRKFLKIAAMLTSVRVACACCLAALMWLGVFAGAKTGREVFSRLMLPSARSTEQDEAPPEAEMRLELRNVGDYVQELAQLPSARLSDDCARGLACVDRVSLVLGRGCSLPMVEYGLQVRALRRWEAAWTAKARPELVPAIRRAFRRQEQVCKEDLLRALDSFRVAPTYLALSAKPGREKDFAAVYEKLVAYLRQMPEREAGAQPVERGNLRGVRVSQRRAWEFLTGRSLNDPDICRVLDRKQVCLLTSLQAGSALVLLCEDPSDSTLPGSPNEVMPLPAAPSRELLASWDVSTELCRAWQNALRLRRMNLAQSCVNALREASMDDPQRASVYNAAQEALCELFAEFGPSPLSRCPLKVRVWQTDGGILAEAQTDALQSSFSPGTLRHSDQADAAAASLYLESTPFSCPAACVSTDVLIEKLPAVYRGVVLTLRPEACRRVEKYAAYAQMFGSELEAAVDAVGSLWDGTRAPFALIAARAAGASPAWALCAGIKKRTALSRGWEQMLNCAGQSLEKLGVPSMALDVLPIEHGKLANGADTYSLGLPLLESMTLPCLVINDRELVLGNDVSLNARLIANSSDDLPFCGAACCAHLPTLASIVSSKRRLRPLSADCVALLARHFNRLYAVSGIADGTLSLRIFLTEGIR